MKTNNLYKWGIGGLSCVVLFRFLLLLFLSYQTRNTAISNFKMPPFKIFTWLEIAVMLLVILEAVTYFTLKNKIQSRLWVRLHVWCLFFVMFFIPLIMMSLLLFGLLHLGNNKVSSFMPLFNKIRFYIAWALTITGHGAFIVVLIKSMSIQKKTEPVETTDGILDEFITD